MLYVNLTFRGFVANKIKQCVINLMLLKTHEATTSQKTVCITNVRMWAHFTTYRIQKCQILKLKHSRLIEFHVNQNVYHAHHCIYVYKWRCCCKIVL